MPFDPQNPDDLAELDDAIAWSDKRKSAHEKQVVSHIRQLVGQNYGDDGSESETPINMIELGVRIFSREITAHNPQCMVDSPFQELIPCASDMALSINEDVNRIDLKDANNRCGLDALFKMGMMEVGITTKETPPDGEDSLADPGHLFAEPVLFADAILDMRAKRWNGQRFIGHRFEVTREWVINNSSYDRKVRKRIAAKGREDESARQEDSPDRHPESIGRGSVPPRDGFKAPMILQQLFLTDEKRVVIRAEGHELLPLNDFDWKGPERGPYHQLGFGNVPGNLVPTGCVPYWVELHDIVNRNFTKAARQAERQKTILGVPKSNTDDGEVLVDSQDGFAYGLDDPKACQEFSMGGANERTLAMAQLAKQTLDWLGGNWSSVAGLAAQSRTVGQDELLANNASSQIRDMQQTMAEFEAGIFQSMAFWMWNDPISEYHLIKPIEGTKYGIPITFSPDKRMGRFTNYNFTTNPYSRQVRAPSEEAQELVQFVTQIFLPMMPALQQQGISIDFELFFKMFARLMNRPDLNRLVIYSQGEKQPQRGPVEAPGMPQSTTRSYVRENRPAGTKQGQDEALISHLLGAPKQPSEMAGLLRPAS